VSALAFVEELERRDELAAAALAEVEELQALAADVRTRAEAMQRFFDELPALTEQRAAAAREAVDQLRVAKAAREEAERALEQAARKRREQDRVTAERHAEDARDAERLAAAEVERTRLALGQLAREAGLAREQSGELEREAADLANRVAGLARITPEATQPPEPGLDGVAAWAARVRPALLLLQSSTVVERDSIIREANELGSAVLGEALGATSVTGVRDRIRRALAQTPT
jgi:hypothetical protein